MEVPSYNRSIGVEAPGSVAPTLQPMTPASSGANIGQAIAGVGNQVQSLGGELLGHMITKKNADMEQEVHDKFNPVAQSMHDDAIQRLSTEGYQAKGITHGDNLDPTALANAANTGGNVTAAIQAQDKSFQSSYVGTSLKRKADFVSQFTDPRQARLANNLYDAADANYRNAVSEHEVKQMRVATEQGLAASTLTAAQAASIRPNTNPFDDPMVQANNSRTYDLTNSMAGPDAAKLAVQKNNDFIALERVKNFPSEASSILANDKVDISPDAKAKIRGVQVDNLQNTITQQIVQGNKNIVNPDGTPNLQKTLDFVQSQADANKFLPEQTQRAEQMAREAISTKTAEISQNREQNQKSFYNTLAQMFNAGKNSDAIKDALLKKSHYDFTGMPASDKQTQEDAINEFFTNQQSAYNKSLNYLSPEQQSAVALAKQAMEAKVGKKASLKLMDDGQPVNLLQTLNDNLDRKVAGSSMTPQEIAAYADDSTKQVVTKPGFFSDDKQPGLFYEHQYGGVVETQKAMAAPVYLNQLQQYDPQTYQAATKALGPNARPAEIMELAKRIYKNKAAMKARTSPPAPIPTQRQSMSVPNANLKPISKEQE